MAVQYYYAIYCVLSNMNIVGYIALVLNFHSDTSVVYSLSSFSFGLVNAKICGCSV